mgnify:CR=1 FL=1
MAKSKSNKTQTTNTNTIELERIRSNERREKFVTVCVVIQSSVKSGCYVCIAIVAYYSIREIAGKTTILNMVVNAVIAFGKTCLIWKIIALLSMITTAWVLITKRRTVHHMSGHTKSLEAEYDPDRSTSGLTSVGVNPKGER